MENNTLRGPNDFKENNKTIIYAIQDFKNLGYSQPDCNNPIDILTIATPRKIIEPALKAATLWLLRAQ